MNSSRTFFLLFSLLFLSSGCSAERIRFEKGTVGIHDMTMRVEIARTPEQRQRGLMYRKRLKEDRGMLFVFEKEQKLSFWMKNTSLPLSIAYIGKDGRIKEIHDMTPFSRESVPSTYYVKYALEVNRGFFERHGIEPGDKVLMDY